MAIAQIPRLKCQNDVKRTRGTWIPVEQEPENVERLARIIEKNGEYFLQLIIRLNQWVRRFEPKPTYRSSKSARGNVTSPPPLFRPGPIEYSSTESADQGADASTTTFPVPLGASQPGQVVTSKLHSVNRFAELGSCGQLCATAEKELKVSNNKLQQRIWFITPSQNKGSIYRWAPGRNVAQINFWGRFGYDRCRILRDCHKFLPKEVLLRDAPKSSAPQQDQEHEANLKMRGHRNTTLNDYVSVAVHLPTRVTLTAPRS